MNAGVAVSALAGMRELKVAHAADAFYKAYAATTLDGREQRAPAGVCSPMGLRDGVLEETYGLRARRALRTNGKAERSIQLALREWAYGWTYQNSAE